MIDDPKPVPHDSPGYRMAYVLYHWPRPAIERHLLRSLLPAGVTRPRPSTAFQPTRYTASGHKKAKSRNKTSETFKAKLKMWEDSGHVRRDDAWVHILNREFFAEAASRLRLDRAMWLAEVVQDYRQAPVDPELRRRELLALQALMEGRDVHHASGRRAVRIVPRGVTL